jgi:glycosyltransferase involved in cell wall biosynthesis
MPMRIAVCTSQVPFAFGGAEVLADALVAQLRKRGHQVDLVKLPQRWYPKDGILENYLMWRLVNTLDKTSERQPIHRVIALKYPAYAVPHEYKITWLIQQLRQAYDWLGTPYTFFGNTPEDLELLSLIRRMDQVTIGESRHVFSISGNVAGRLRKYNQMESDVLYPPPAMDGRFHNEDYGDFIFSVSRLNMLKRVDHLVRAMGRVRTAVRCRIAGSGPDLGALRRLARQVGAGDRIDFLGFVEDESLLDLYSRSLAVYYAPFDEDYGLATIEAMKSQKPVLTTDDSGGVLEFVEEGVTGYVTPPDDAAALAQRIDELYENRQLARRMGQRAAELVAGITWDVTIKRLLEA